jgi:hypothetical protein
MILVWRFVIEISAVVKLQPANHKAYAAGGLYHNYATVPEDLYFRVVVMPIINRIRKTTCT